MTSHTRKPASLRVVLVEWYDAHAVPGWIDATETQGSTCPVTSIGILISRSKAQVVIAQTVSWSDGKLGDALVIPGKMVKRVVQLEPAVEWG